MISALNFPFYNLPREKMHISHMCVFRGFPSNRAGPGRASTTKKEIKTVKKSVCPAIVLDTSFLLKRRLREISTYYFVFSFLL